MNIDYRIITEIDFSMVELRLLAWYTQDPVMLEELRNGVDLHKSTAAMTYKIPIEDVTKTQRKKAKGMNFGAWYGGGDDRLASSINEKLEEGEERITPQEVGAIRRLLFHKYHVAADYIDWKTGKLRDMGYTVSCFGRHRRVPQVFTEGDDPKAKKAREEGVREGFNSDIQGGASDINQFSLLAIWDIIKDQYADESYWMPFVLNELGAMPAQHRVGGWDKHAQWLREDASRPMFTVHDSQIWEMTLEGIFKWIPIINAIMSNPPEPVGFASEWGDSIRTPVEFQIHKYRWGGDNWEVATTEELMAVEPEIRNHFGSIDIQQLIDHPSEMEVAV